MKIEDKIKALESIVWDLSAEVKALKVGKLPHELISQDELAEYFGVSRTTIDRLKQKGLPHIVFSGSIRFNLKEVLEWTDRTHGGKIEDSGNWFDIEVVDEYGYCHKSFGNIEFMENGFRIVGKETIEYIDNEDPLKEMRIIFLENRKIRIEFVCSMSSF